MFLLQSNLLARKMLTVGTSCRRTARRSVLWLHQPNENEKFKNVRDRRMQNVRKLLDEEADVQIGVVWMVCNLLSL